MTYHINITHLYIFFHQKGNEQFKYKISQTILSFLVFELAGFLAIHTQFEYYQQRKQFYFAYVYMKLDFVSRDLQKYYFPFSDN